MLAPLRGAVGPAAVAALVLIPGAVVAAPAAAAPRAVTSEPVGGPLLGTTGVVVKAGPGTTALPKIPADSWLLADITTGEVLAAKAPHLRVRPASTLKTLTSITLMPVLPKDEQVTIGPGPTHADGSHVGLVQGATYSVWDLWHGLLLPSGNDAAMALAEAGDGGVAGTVKAMQAKARELGALDTSVRNPSGLDHKSQFTSAYDMALFARAAMSIEDFRTVTATTHYDFPGKMPAAGAKRSTYRIYTQNRLLLHDYPGAVGGKTGFTSLARRTFWGAAERGGHTLVVTLFNIGEPTETAAKKLLTWGFANRARLTPVGTLVAPAEAAPSSEPSAGATTDPVNGAAAAGGTAAVAGSTAVSLGSGLRGLLLPALVVVLLALLGWWWWRRRDRTGEPPAQRAPVPPDPRAAAPSVPVVPVLPEPVRSDDTAPVPVVRPEAAAPAAPPPAAPVVPAAPAPDAPAAAEPEPAPPAPAAERPAPAPGGGNVRVVRPPSRPEQ